MMRPPFLLVLGLLALGGLPGAQAQVAGITNPTGAAVTLHLHLVGAGTEMPINTQPAQFGFVPEPAVALGADTLTCVPDASPVGPHPQENHVYRGYSSPGYVEYGVRENGMPRVFPERQMGYATSLDVGVPPILHWYLETTPAPGGSPENPPLVVPNVVVKATLRQSDGISIDDKAYDSGAVIAQGQSAPALLAADASQGVEHSMVDGHHVYGFAVPMPLQQAALGLRGFTLRIDVFLDNPACSDPGGAGSLMPSLVQPYADADHRPGISTAVLDPLRILRLNPQFVGSDVVLHGTVQSPWGNYDVDEGNLTLSMDGPTGHSVLEPAARLQRYHEHGHHDQPVDIAWVFNRSAAPAGLYRFNVTIGNDQHTANATATAAVNLRPDVAYNATLPATAVRPPSRAAGGLPVGAVLLLVWSVAWLRGAKVLKAASPTRPQGPSSKA